MLKLSLSLKSGNIKCWFIFSEVLMSIEDEGVIHETFRKTRTRYKPLKKSYSSQIWLAFCLFAWWLFALCLFAFCLLVWCLFPWCAFRVLLSGVLPFCIMGIWRIRLLLRIHAFLISMILFQLLSIELCHRYTSIGCKRKKKDRREKERRMRRRESLENQRAMKSSLIRTVLIINV